jgi:hypothetical protein
MDRGRARARKVAAGWFVAALLFGVSGCSFSYPLDVGFSAGRIVFSAKEKSSGCLNYFEVTSSTGELMWKFEGPLRLGDCRSDLPLTYGHAPSSVTSLVSAKRLQFNVKYFVAASDGDSYYGSFRIRPVLRLESDPNEGQNGPFFKGDAANMTKPATNGS